ncbi:hypothetical protein ACFL1S_02280 [Pseudomonadota bacterium]
MADTWHRYRAYSTGRFNCCRTLMATPGLSRRIAAVASPNK